MLRPRSWPALLALLLPAACSRAPEGPNVLLISLDTTRRDHLGCYGYERPTSPQLDRLAADSVIYTNGYAVSSWTLPTHASMFTGKLPSAHGANYDPEGPLILSEGIEGGFDQYRARPIAENEITLAMLLTEHGYATGGVIAGPWMKKIFQLGRGFESYDDSGVTALNGRPAEDVTRSAIEFVDAHADRPFFLFLNYYDPHSPWVDPDGRPFHDLRPVTPPGIDLGALSRAEQARLLYDAEIRYMDQHIGRLLDHLRERGLYENTWIFVVADHGELLGDSLYDGHELWGHGDSLSQAEIHIPFLVKEPGSAPRSGADARAVQQTDILPTVLERLGIPLPPNVQGKPLGTRHPIVAELEKLPVMDRMGQREWPHLGNWRALVEHDDKLLWSANGTHVRVDLARDPGEQHNVFGQEPEREALLMSALTKIVENLPEPGAPADVGQVTPEEMEMLRALGYVGEDARPGR